MGRRGGSTSPNYVAAAWIEEEEGSSSSFPSSFSADPIRYLFADSSRTLNLCEILLPASIAKDGR